MSIGSVVTAKYDHGGRRRWIVESLLADIFQGRLRAGKHLVTQELAERFSVSHTPVREALIALSGIGILDILPNRGAVVRRVTARDVREIMQVRRALECEAIRSASGRIDLKELHSLAEDIRRLGASRAGIRGKFIEQARSVDSRLHDLIAGSCGNEFLGKELNRLKILFRAFRDVSYVQHEARNDFRRLAEEAREHLEIVEALLASDRKGAVKAMSRHLLGGVKYWSRALPEDSADSADATNGMPPLNGSPRRLPTVSRPSRKR